MEAFSRLTNFFLPDSFCILFLIYIIIDKYFTEVDVSSKHFASHSYNNPQHPSLTLWTGFRQPIKPPNR